MPKDAHNKAAEHHENAAKSHRMAAEHHRKGEHEKGREHASQARAHSENSARTLRGCARQERITEVEAARRGRARGPAFSLEESVGHRGCARTKSKRHRRSRTDSLSGHNDKPEENDRDGISDPAIIRITSNCNSNGPDIAISAQDAPLLLR